MNILLIEYHIGIISSPQILHFILHVLQSLSNMYSPVFFEFHFMI